MLRSILFCLSLSLPLLSIAAEKTDSDSAGGRLLAAWIEAYNSGRPASIDGFRDKYGLTSDTVDVLTWRDDSGPVRVLRIERDDAEAIVALLQPASSDSIERIQFDLTATKPVRNASLTYLNADRPPDLALPRMTQAEALAAWKHRGDEMAADDRFSGVVLAARDGEVVAQHVWGLADRDAGKPVALDTRFRLGSMNKMFTAVAVLQLVEAGKVALDDTLGEHLPDYPNRALADHATIAQLLSHTAGAGDIFGPEFEAKRLALRSHADYVALYGSRAPEFTPGAQFRYANYGYVLLGAVIERVSGQSYYDYVDEHIYAKAGMTDSGSPPEDVVVARRAHAYRRENAAWVDAAETLPYRGTAAGGGYSTVADLLRFARALDKGTLVSKALLAQALSPKTEDGWYGFGFMARGGGSPWYGHHGGAQGMNAVFQVHPESGWTLIALSNLDPPAAERLAGFLENRMPLQR